ncbi:MAG: SCO family protein [Actinomycetota bacterium]|nr:SCO family protein [Actinomycetota bacterium]
MPGTDGRNAKGRIWVVALVALIALAGGCGPSKPGRPSANLGTVIPARPVPAIPLLTVTGASTSLAAYRGRYVLLAPSLTLCQEVCPITTGALTAIQHDLNRDGLASKVVIAELTVDPTRDTPARLSAYAHQFGVPFTLLTGTNANIAQLWSFFHFSYQNVPEPTPAGTDWWTGQALTYDVNHQNGFILIDPAGNERFVTLDMPGTSGRLRPDLKALLDNQGIANLTHSDPTITWIVPQALHTLGWLMGQTIAHERAHQALKAPARVGGKAVSADRPLPVVAKRGVKGVHRCRLGRCVTPSR